jgi:streptomycin 6-kinase
VAKLLTSLHATGVPDPSYPSLMHRVAYLFDSGMRPRTNVVRSSSTSSRLLCTNADGGLRPGLPSTSRRQPLLHGELTPRNILDGGAQRGLVAIDPAPCFGNDLAFDAIDLLLWQAEDVDMIAVRAEQLAPAIEVDPAGFSTGARRSQP